MTRNERVMEHYDYLVVLVKQRALGWGLPPSDEADLLQTCLAACVEADDRYDADKGSAYRTFLHSVANYECIEYFNRHSEGVVPLPRRLSEEWARARRTYAQLETQLQRTPRHREVAEAMGLSLEDYETLRNKADYSQVSLEELASGHSDEACLGEEFVGAEELMAGDGVIPGPERLVLTDEVQGKLREQIDMLPTIEREIVILTFGLDETRKEHSARDIEQGLGIPRTTVLRRLDSGVNTLRMRLDLLGVDMETLSFKGRATA